jgi:hypothetical protein
MPHHHGTRKTSSALASATALILASGAALAADNGVTGNGAPPGAHYNLNIIGVEKGKNPTMTGSNRHTIFVPLKSTKTGELSKPNFDSNGTGAQTAIVDSKIWLVPGDTFKVCDGNAFDLAYGCDDTYLGDWGPTTWTSEGTQVALVSPRNGAVFQLPCNTNLNGQFWDSDGDGVVETNGDDAELDQLVSCNQAIDVDGNVVDVGEDFELVPTASYQVWARALGKPGGSAVSTTCATVQGELQCSLENVVMTRTGRKSVFADVTNQMTSMVIGFCQDDVVTIAGVQYCVDPLNPVPGSGDVEWTRVALFAGNTQDWFWNFDNNGLRLAQLRFYEL